MISIALIIVVVITTTQAFRQLNVKGLHSLQRVHRNDEGFLKLSMLGREKGSSSFIATKVPSSNQHRSMSLNGAKQLFGYACNQNNVKMGALIVAITSAVIVWLNRTLWAPSRTYNRDENSVGREYDAWTKEGILEYYWGEHIHLGYYTDEELQKGYKKKNFIQAKYDFIDRMMEFGEVKDLPKDAKILDVGCGIGGTSRYLAKKFGDGTQVTGITLSNAQQQRATQLAKDRGIGNADFKVMDALNMDFPDNSFDVVWGCESGEHMPDKEKYIQEMNRVLKPGGKIVVATWCQRDSHVVPFTAKERKVLDFLYAEWTHPYFISINDYAKIMERTGTLASITTADWVKETIASWRHSIWVGVFDPWPVVIRPKLWWKCLRDGITLERMHQAFNDGLMQYGMITATKMQPVKAEPAVQVEEAAAPPQAI